MEEVEKKCFLVICVAVLLVGGISASWLSPSHQKVTHGFPAGLRTLTHVAGEQRRSPESSL